MGGEFLPLYTYRDDVPYGARRDSPHYRGYVSAFVVIRYGRAHRTARHVLFQGQVQIARIGHEADNGRARRHRGGARDTVLRFAHRLRRHGTLIETERADIQPSF